MSKLFGVYSRKQKNGWGKIVLKMCAQMCEKTVYVPTRLLWEKSEKTFKKKIKIKNKKITPK